MAHDTSIKDMNTQRTADRGQQIEICCSEPTQMGIVDLGYYNEKSVRSKAEVNQ